MVASFATINHMKIHISTLDCQVNKRKVALEVLEDTVEKAVKEHSVLGVFQENGAPFGIQDCMHLMASLDLEVEMQTFGILLEQLEVRHISLATKGVVLSQ